MVRTSGERPYFPGGETKRPRLFAKRNALYGQKGKFSSLLLSVALSFPFFSLQAAQPEDFAVRLIGGGEACTGDSVEVEVKVDLNLTGTNQKAVRGFSLAVCHIPYQLQIEKALPGPAVDEDQGGTPVDFLQISVKNRGVIEALIVGLREDRGLPPENDLSVLSLTYRVEDAAGGAQIYPCSGELSTPPVMISFSTGSENFTPPPENLLGTSVFSACEPEVRRIHVQLSDPDQLKVLCGTHEGSTSVPVIVWEEALSCCNAQLVGEVKLLLKVPADLRVVQFVPEVHSVLETKLRQNEDFTQVILTFLPSLRFPTPVLLGELILEPVPEAWDDFFLPTERVIELFAAPSGEKSGVTTVTGNFLAFEEAQTGSTKVEILSSCQSFKRGDVNADGAIDIADPISLLTWLYGNNAPPPRCYDAADANDDGLLNIADAIYSLSYLYGGLTSLPPPFEDCEVDPSRDKLGCEAFPPCSR